MTSAAPGPFRVMLVEDDDAYARLIATLFDERDDSDLFPDLDLLTVQRLSAARHRLSQRDVGLVLLDLTLPDSEGLGTVTTLASEYPEVPIVVVTSVADQELALRALQIGAQDYLIKSEVDRRSLLKSMRYALERHRLQEQLRNLSLTDALTGLYNRRGFMTLAGRQLKLATRRARRVVVVLLDVDGLKLINDRYGHAEGDRALQQVALALRSTFRDEDIVARLGGDEFAVLTLDVTAEAVGSVLARMHEQLLRATSALGERFTVAVSSGWCAAELDDEPRRALDSLLAEADRRLYREKAQRHATTAGSTAHKGAITDVAST